MCNSIGGGAKAIPGAATTLPDAPPPKVGGASGSGCGGGAPTQFEMPPGSNVAGLRGSLEDGLRRLQAPAPGQHPGQFGPGLAGGGPGGTTSFQAADAQEIRVPLLPITDGASAIENLRRLAGARTERLRILTDALATDSQAAGSTNPVNAQKLVFERQTSEQLNALVQKLTPLAPTIDVSEGTALLKLVGDANRTGQFEPSQLARVLIQVEGSAANLPASYLASANRGQDFAAGIDRQVTQLSNAVAGTANQTGSFDPVQLQQVTQLTQDRAKLSDALKRNFELAKTNPSEAQARLDRALRSSDLATVTAALG